MQETPDATTRNDPPVEEERVPKAGPVTSALEGTEAAPSLEESLKQAERAAQDHHDAWLRAKAEAENIRKRAQIEISSAHRFALENFASDLLPVKDSLEAALTTENATVESMRSGVEITQKQLTAVFDRFHITEVNPLGEKFDPHRHQAISMDEKSGAEPNTVVKVLQKGYLLHDRVIRPALVIVAKRKG